MPKRLITCPTHSYSTTIELNGTLFDPIPLNRGVRQGCPLSMLLFITITDILSQKISQAKNIHGIKLLSSTIKIQQYANDTSIILTDEDNIIELANILSDFSAQSGLALNIKQSKIMSNSSKISQIIQSHFPAIQKV